MMPSSPLGLYIPFSSSPAPHCLVPVSGLTRFAPLFAVASSTPSVPSTLSEPGARRHVSRLRREIRVWRQSLGALRFGVVNLFS